MDTLSEQGLANVLNACAKLEKARLAVERLDPTGDASRGWRLFTSRVASLAPRAGDQGLSVALHALTLCGDDARASVDEGGWRAFETAALRLAPTASPQAAAMLLNGAWKLAAEPSATRNGFSFGDVVLEALGRRAAEILVEEASSSSSSCLTTSFDEQATFVAADALGKLPAASTADRRGETPSSRRRRRFLFLLVPNLRLSPRAFFFFSVPSHAFSFARPGFLRDPRRERELTSGPSLARGYDFLVRSARVEFRAAPVLAESSEHGMGESGQHRGGS